jgi:ABC-type dipeptide/oligopeptide/nickel transport system permease component
VELTLAALLVAILIAVPLALVAARRPGTLWDQGGTVASLFGISMPSFWLGIMLILVFAVKLNILPASGVVDPGSDVPVRTGFSLVDALLAGDPNAFGDALLHLLLPAITLGAAVAATIARVLRSSLIEVGGQEHVEALHARGLRASSIIRHLLRNALPATVVVVGVRIGALLGGAIIVETVFSWPGMGWLIVQSIGQRDYPVVQGAVLTIAVLVALVNFATDLLHAWLDPRVQLVGGTR